MRILRAGLEIGGRSSDNDPPNLASCPMKLFHDLKCDRWKRFLLYSVDLLQLKKWPTSITKCPSNLCFGRGLVFTNICSSVSMLFTAFIYVVIWRQINLSELRLHVKRMIMKNINHLMIILFQCINILLYT